MISAPSEINQGSHDIAVVIPARNEEFYLPRCLEALKSAAEKAQLKTEILLVANRCTDNTENIARSFGCAVIHCDAKNLAVIRNVGVRATSAPWVVTVDADSRVSPNMFIEIRKYVEAGNVIGGGVLILPERWSLGIFLTGCLLLPYVLFERLAGGLFFFTREAFEAIDGFDESFHSVEDIDFARRLKRFARKANKKFQIVLRAHIVTSTRKFDRLGDWYFIKHPLLFWRLLHNRDSEGSRKIWYDFER